MPPRLARLVAVLVALALVAGAFALRGALSGDDDPGGGGGSGGGDDGSDVRLLCDDDLGEAACAALGQLDGVASVEVMTADQAVTAMTEGAAIDFDAWVTLDPLPLVLDEARKVAGLVPVAADGDPVPLASSTPAVLTRDSGGSACETPVTWACLAGEATDGDRVGVPTLRSAAGTLVLGAAAAGLEGTPDFGIDQVTGTVEDQLRDLLDSADPGTLAEQDALATRPGTFTSLVTTTGLADATADTSQGTQQGLTTVPVDPATRIGVVLAPLGPAGPAGVDRLRDQATGQTVADGLAEAGWTGDAARSEGLPAPDLLYALDERFTR